MYIEIKAVIVCEIKIKYGSSILPSFFVKKEEQAIQIVNVKLVATAAPIDPYLGTNI